MVEKSGTVEVRFYKENCASLPGGGKEGTAGTVGTAEVVAARCLLNICIPRCRWKIFRCRLHRGGFIYIMHCPSTVSVCVLSTARYPPFLRLNPENSRFLPGFPPPPSLARCRRLHVSRSLVITTEAGGWTRQLFHVDVSSTGRYVPRIIRRDTRRRETGDACSLRLSVVSHDPTLVQIKFQFSEFSSGGLNVIRWPVHRRPA